MALWIGFPVRRSQTIVVSRWLVMPMAAMSSAVSPARAMASTATPSCEAQISLASCSTRPGWGKIWRNSFWASPRTFPSWSNTTARELVVPWSRARMKLIVHDLLHGAQYGIHMTWIERERCLKGRKKETSADLHNRHLFTFRSYQMCRSETLRFTPHISVPTFINHDISSIGCSDLLCHFQNFACSAPIAGRTDNTQRLLDAREQLRSPDTFGRVEVENPSRKHETFAVLANLLKCRQIRCYWRAAKEDQV